MVRIVMAAALIASAWAIGGTQAWGASLSGFKLDPDYGKHGVVSSDFESEHPSVTKVGKGFIASAGSESESAIAKFNLAGKRIMGFGDGGETPYPWSAAIARYRTMDVVRQPDGKLLVVATLLFEPGTTNSDYGFELTRFTSDGRVDKAFGDGGLVRYGMKRAVTKSRTAVTAAVTQSGRILVGGQVETARGTRPVIQAFSGDGRRLPQADVVFPAKKQFLALNEITDLVSLRGFKYAAGVSGSNHLLLARIKSNGELDRQFGRRGWTIVRVLAPRCPSVADSCDTAARLSLGRTGTIHALVDAGDTGRFEGRQSATILRFARSGQVFRSFGRSGRMLVPYSKKGRTGLVVSTMMTLQDDQLLLAGAFQHRGKSATRLTLVTRGGSIDRHFGTNGFQGYAPLSRLSIDEGFLAVGQRVRLVGVSRASGQLASARLLPQLKR